MSSITALWESPIPNVKRPEQAAWAVSACCASAAGCRGGVGTTAVTSSIVPVSQPATVSIETASRLKMLGTE